MQGMPTVPVAKVRKTGSEYLDQQPIITVLCQHGQLRDGVTNV
jgi:hypothetical protein